MDDISPSDNIHIGFHRKYKKYSELIDKTPESQLKRLKIDSPSQKGRLSNSKEVLNVALLSNNAQNCQEELIPRVNLIKLALNDKNNPLYIKDKYSKQTPLKVKAGKSPKDKETHLYIENIVKDDKSKVRSEKNSKVKKNQTIEEYSQKKKDENIISKIKKSSKNIREKLNTSFLQENHDIPKDRFRLRQTKQRRLSGLFKNDLNTGFIEDSLLNDDKTEAEVIFQETNNENAELHPEIIEDDSEVEEKGIVLTPVKSKLRNKKKKEPTEEDIIKYYTNNTVKKKQNILETIFEVPKPEIMSVKKYRRYINFNERMSKSKIKKRCNKIVKYNLWENKEPVSMDYFVGKMEEIKKDL